MIQWYRKEAYNKISAYLDYHIRAAGFSCDTMRLSNAKKRWGSCSRGNRLRFSWRLIMAPEPVIEYVVLHELAHTKVKNHSPAFWNIVKTLDPHYKEHIRWLKNNAHLLIA